jgi:nucleoside-diphosphate-sugar epimerase
MARIRSEPPMTRFVAKQLATSHWYDLTAAKRDLGYTPQVTIAEGLSRLREWLQTASDGGHQLPNYSMNDGG